jgi:general secretion pathway protein D
MEFSSGTETFVGAPLLAIKPVDALSMPPGPRPSAAQRPAALPRPIQRSETAPVPQEASAPPAPEPQTSNAAIPPMETASTTVQTESVPAAEGKFRDD